jgi:hypothetical protein
LYMSIPRGSLGEPARQKLLELLPQKTETVVELGSGHTTKFMVEQGYTVYSIEENEKFINQYHNNYLHAPIENEWYSTGKIQEFLPSYFDLLLIDGPWAYHASRRHRRLNFIPNIQLFGNLSNTIIFVDDVNRKNEFKLLTELAEILNRDCRVFKDRDKDRFGVIFR